MSKEMLMLWSDLKMSLRTCPNCQRVFVTMDGPGYRDIVHVCNSGNNTQDQQDRLNTSSQTWNKLGLTNSLSTKAKIQGAKFNGVTRRGNKAPLYRQRQRRQFIELSGKGECC